MGLSIVLSNSSGEPIYQQIKNQIRAAILGGDFVEGQALPSIRGLARDLQVSVITTTRAFSDLAAEGFITNVPGKGSYVLPRNEELIREQVLREVEELFTAGVQKARLAGIADAELTELLHIITEQEER